MSRSDISSVLESLNRDDKNYVVPGTYHDCIVEILSKSSDDEIDEQFYEIIGVDENSLQRTVVPRNVTEHLIKDMLRVMDRYDDGMGGFYIHDFEQNGLTVDEQKCVRDLYSDIDSYFVKNILKKNSTFRKVMTTFVSRCGEVACAHLLHLNDFFIQVIENRQWFLFHQEHLKQLIDLFGCVNRDYPKLNNKMSQMLVTGFEKLFEFNKETFDSAPGWMLKVKEFKEVRTNDDNNDDSKTMVNNSDFEDGHKDKNNNGDIRTDDDLNMKKRNSEVVTPPSSPPVKKGKNSVEGSFFANLRKAKENGTVKNQKFNRDGREFEFHYNLSEPVIQENNTVRVCLMMNGFVSKVKGNDMFIFKPYMVKKTFQLLSAIGDTVIEHKYAKEVIECMRHIGKKKKFPGEASNETVKIDKSNKYDALVLCGVIELKCDGRSTNAEIKDEMMHVVEAFHGIITSEKFHEHYKIGAYVDQVYPSDSTEQALNELYDFFMAGKTIDDLIKDKKDTVKMAYLIMEDKDGRIKNFHSFGKKVNFNVALDSVLVDDACNTLIPKLVGIFTEKHAHIIMRSPSNRSHGWINNSANSAI